MPAPAPSSTDEPHPPHAQTVARRSVYWFLVAFLVALSIFALRNIAEKADGLSNAAAIRDWTRTSTTISLVIHELQKERGMSSGFIASSSRNFAETLGFQRLSTDQSLAALDEKLLPGDATPPVVERLREKLAALPRLRDNVSELKLSREFIVERYTDLIDDLFELQLTTFGQDIEAAVLRQQMAFVSLMQAKEMAGQERALLAAMLSDKNFSAGRMAAYHRIKAVEDARVSNFLRLAHPAATHTFQEILTQPDAARADRIRLNIVAASLREANGNTESDYPLPKAEEWFSVSSSKIEALKRLEDELGLAVNLSAHQLENRASHELMINGLLALLSFVLAAVLLNQIQRGRRVAEHRLSLADAVYQNSVESILITDAALKIIDINPAFSQVTGYERQEILGRHPRLLKSGRHGADFYERMWHHLQASGSWKGEVWNRRKNGEIYPALLSIVAVRNHEGQTTNYTGMIFDLSQHQKVEALLEQLRTFDALTGLPNREFWLSALDQAIAGGQRNQGCFAVLELDLDRFKIINDSMGHTAGDAILIDTAERIKNTLRKQDLVTRPGGNRFSILLNEITSPQDVATICEKLLAAFVEPFELDGVILHVTASLGAAIFPSDGHDTKTLMMAAESALYSAKADGRNLYKYYAREMNELGAQLLKLERMLRLALDHDEFSVVYQPQISAGDERLVGVEALLRWNNPELGQVSPVQFIPVAEETGLIVAIGEWVMRVACQQALAWHKELGFEVPVAVNLSARQFRRSDLLATVAQILDETGLPSHLLELEITEGLLMSDPLGAIEIMRGLHAMGVRTALDDFGTGYSSLAYLKAFPLDRLKIDRAFVRDLPDNASDRAISNTVIALGLNLDMEVLAEGVETEAQRDFLAESGCQVFQGYFYGKPMSAGELSQRIGRGEFRPPIAVDRDNALSACGK